MEPYPCQTELSEEGLRLAEAAEIPAPGGRPCAEMVNRAAMGSDYDDTCYMIGNACAHRALGF